MLVEAAAVSKAARLRVCDGDGANGAKVTLLRLCKQHDGPGARIGPDT